MAVKMPDPLPSAETATALLKAVSSALASLLELHVQVPAHRTGISFADLP